ncbi:MAG: hypothetical protein J2P58_07445 [Acidimicrobiaceae bacterium]|nr:hypothetical protein [Acidimicrobiaceae bacterium]
MQHDGSALGDKIPGDARTDAGATAGAGDEHDATLEASVIWHRPMMTPHL